MTNEQAKKVISLIKEKIRLSQNEELDLFLQLVNNTYYDYEVNVGYYKGVVEKLIYSTIIKREHNLVGQIMSRYITDTIIGDVRLEQRVDVETDFEFYDVYKVTEHPYKENDRYIGELWSMNEGKALKDDLNVFLKEKGY